MHTIMIVLHATAAVLCFAFGVGFVIVLAINLGAPGWLTAAVAVLGVFVGIRALQNVKTVAAHAR